MRLLSPASANDADVFMDVSKPALIEGSFVGGSEDPSAMASFKFSNWPSLDDAGNPVTILIMVQ